MERTVSRPPCAPSLKRAISRRFIMSQNDRLVRYLSTGRTISAAQARSRFGIRNLRARVNDLRSEGFCVYTNRGETTTYRMGRPSRSIVAAAYQTAGSRIFGGN
jgi:hypothetical protein